MNADHTILRLINQFLHAKERHDEAFNEVGEEANNRCSKALESMDDAFLGVCATRPASKAGQYVQEEFIKARIVDLTVGRPKFRGDAYAAIEHGGPVEKSNNGEKSP